MFNFYHQINLYSLLYLFIILNIAICSSSNINRAYHYHIDDTQGIVDEIRIDFSYLKNEEISLCIPLLSYSPLFSMVFSKIC